MLFRPLSGAAVHAPVMLRWQPAAGATYYNVQPPAAGVDANRTLFHVVAGKNEDEQ